MCCLYWRISYKSYIFHPFGIQFIPILTKNKYFKKSPHKVTWSIKIKRKPYCDESPHHVDWESSRISTIVEIQIFWNSISNLSHILFFWFQTCMIAEYLLTKVSLRGFKGIYQIWSLNLFHSRINPTSLMQVDFKINIYSIKQKQEYVSKQHCFMWNTITFFLFFGRGVCVGGSWEESFPFVTYL